MKLDVKAMRYLTPEDWRVLTAVEMGSRNHEIVPTPLIAQIAGLRGGSGIVHKSISTLAKTNLIARVKNAKYDGYRLTYGGLDYLALHAHLKSGAVYSVGNQIGVGKESDIFVVAAPPPSSSSSSSSSSRGSGTNGRSGSGKGGSSSSNSNNSIGGGSGGNGGAQLVLKLHRLGRVSFRSVKAKRDYLRHRATGSWLYLSRLAAHKEHACLRALAAHGFPVPRPVAHNRHTVVMELIDAFPLRQIARVPDPAGLYAELMAIIVRLARVGLIHGDFNEFNILVREERRHEKSASAAAAAGDGSSSSSGSEANTLGTDERPGNSDGRKNVTSTQPEGAPGAAAAATAAAAAAETLEAADAADADADAAGAPSVKLVPIIIDFPQMVSTSHANAQMYFDRDVHCIKRFFERRFRFVSAEPGPFLADAIAGSGSGSGSGSRASSRDKADDNVRLDVEVEASGFSKKMAKELDAYINDAARDADEASNDSDGGGGDDDDDDDSDDDGDNYDDN